MKDDDKKEERKPYVVLKEPSSYALELVVNKFLKEYNYYILCGGIAVRVEKGETYNNYFQALKLRNK